MTASSSPQAPTSAAATAPDTRHRREIRKSLMASSVGNALEWFDWTVYAIFSTYIAKALFDSTDQVSALLGTLLIFAVGFIARPIGGIVFGALADRLGRKTVLVLTMLMTAVGSLLIGITPSYDAIGGWASILLLVARLTQGFAHGGESTASYAYVSEIAPPARRGLWSSSVYVSIGIGSMIATFFGTLLTGLLSTDAINAWGWRIPFWAGSLLALFVLYLRSGMVEKRPVSADGGQRSASVEAATRLPKSVLFTIGFKLFVFVGGTSIVYYTWNSYAATFAISQRGMSAQGAFAASLAAQVVGIIALPLAGLLSDRVGRRPVLFVWSLGFAVLALPLLNLIGSAPWTLFVAQGIALSLNALATAIFACVLSEQVPDRYRTKVIGIAMSLSVAVFGGTTPYLNTWLHSQGLDWAFVLYFIVLCLASFALVFTWKETRAIPLAQLEKEFLERYDVTGPAPRKVSERVGIES